MEEELECPLCLEFFTSPVRTTTCGHNFCQNCLEPLKTETRWRCPMCMMEQFQRPENLARNFALERILKKFFESRKNIPDTHIDKSSKLEQRLHEEEKKNQTLLEAIENLQICLDDLESQFEKEKNARRRVESEKISLEKNFKELQEDQAQADSKLEKISEKKRI